MIEFKGGPQDGLTFESKISPCEPRRCVITATPAQDRWAVYRRESDGLMCVFVFVKYIISKTPPKLPVIDCQSERR